MATAAASGAASSFASRLWARYLVQLKTKPIRTKMVQSGVIYVVADLTAQFGIEGRRFDPLNEETDETKRCDLVRTARLSFYGTFIFAPLAHFWLLNIEKVKLASRIGTILMRVSIDSLIWSPFVCLMFPSCVGFLEGKNVQQVKDKVKLSWLPTWSTAICVFGPTQLINFTFIPVQHRLLTLQSVGLCWNIFLSFANSRNNRKLAEAAALLQQAEVMDAKNATLRPSIAVEDARIKLHEVEIKREKIKAQGDPVKVGTRIGWA